VDVTGRAAAVRGGQARQRHVGWIAGTTLDPADVGLADAGPF
jgi:hypothetical protein